MSLPASLNGLSSRASVLSENEKGGGQTAIFARGTRTIKRCSFDARSQRPSGHPSNSKERGMRGRDELST